MNLCLITAPIATEFEDPTEAASSQVRDSSRAPHVGILSLAGALDQIGIRPQIFNIDSAYYQYLESNSGGLEAFPNWVAARIVSSGAEVFGFSTICSSYPVTVRIAECVKRLVPKSTVLFGGPQASVVDRETLNAFPFVDMVLRGEADLTLPLLLEELGGRNGLSTVPGLTYRSPFGVQRTTDAPIIDDLDCLPLPAYHLTGELEGEAPYASLELGRGCPFACTFCSTNDFFRRKFRVKSPERMLADMRAIASRYGIRAFDLVHDMFTVDRKRVAAFCDHMIASVEHFTWTCSARTDCVDDELLGLMARAGCEAIFFGVETGSKRMQRIIDKDLDPEQARRAVAMAERHGISTTVSLITGFPEENVDDLRDTVAIFMDSLRHPHSNPQLNLLAPLAGTPIHAKYKDQMMLDHLCSEMSHQGYVQNEADRELIRSFPEIFPNFYVLRTPGLDPGFLLELREFLSMATRRLRWLLAAVDQDGSEILHVLVSWHHWRMKIRPDLSDGPLRRYYTVNASRHDFLCFVRENLAALRQPIVEALLSYYEASMRAEVGRAAFQTPGKPAAGPMRSADIPVRMRDVHVMEMDWDLQSAIEALERREPAVNIRKRKTYRTGTGDDGTIRLIEITPLVAKALQACDGRRTVREVVSELSAYFDCSAPLRRYAGEQLLRAIRRKGFVELYRTASADSPSRSISRGRTKREVPHVFSPLTQARSI
jgi:radical SAM superfamily enzyme YgiQ (UPF0313 family)